MTQARRGHRYELLDQNALMVPSCLEGFPTLKAFCARFEALPAIKASKPQFTEHTDRKGG